MGETLCESLPTLSCDDIVNKAFVKNYAISQNPSDCNGTRTHNDLVPLQSLKLQISRLFRAKSCLTFRQL